MTGRCAGSLTGACSISMGLSALPRPGGLEATATLGDAGDGLDAGKELVVKALDRVGVFVAFVGEIDAGGHELIERGRICWCRGF